MLTSFVLFPLHFLFMFSIPTWPDSFAVIALVPFILERIYYVTYRDRLLLLPDRLRYLRRSWLSRTSRKIAFDDLDVLRIEFPRGVDFGILGRGAILAMSGEVEIEFGRELSKDEHRWLCDTLRYHIAHGV